MSLVLAFIGAVAMAATDPASCNLPKHSADDLPRPAVDLSVGTDQPQQAVFAAGCFWCVEAVFQQLDGVSDVQSGYSGGSAETANYRQVCNGNTGHAEAIRITFDPSKITYGQLLRVFFATHDPTTLNRQGPDTGTQYRSAIFYANEDEKRVSEQYIRQLNQAGVFDEPIVTTLEPLQAFYVAEDYHQDYVDKNPTQPYVRRFALPKVEKVQEKFPDEVKKPTGQ